MIQEKYERKIYFTGPGTYALVEQIKQKATKEYKSENQIIREALTYFLQPKNETLVPEKETETALCTMHDCKDISVATGYHRLLQENKNLCVKHYCEAIRKQKEQIPLWLNLTWTDKNQTLCYLHDCGCEQIATHKAKNKQTGKTAHLCPKHYQNAIESGKWIQEDTA